MKSQIDEELREKIKNHFALLEQTTIEFIPGKTKIPLSVPPYSYEEVIEILDSLFSTYVTMGEKVHTFEGLFADYIGVDHAIMVNSGSSANLLALSIITNPFLSRRIRPGDEIITPAVTWATTVYPIINVGAKPVFVDVELETYNIDPNEVEKAVSDRTKAIVPVHLLGYPCNMKRIMEIGEKHDMYVIEDSCEAHGAEYFGKKVGSFGDMATFSFFLSHHITTIEGGMLVTDNEHYAELAKALRAFGWIRDLKEKDVIARKYQNIDPRFLFINLGFNIRPTEIQGAFGIHQIKKLDRFIEIRRKNASYWEKRLSNYDAYLMLPQEKRGFKHVYFCYPITVKPQAPFTRRQLTEHLEHKGIETRPIMAGNITEQPVINLIEHRRVGDLRNSALIMKNSFFFGNHSMIDKKRREYIADSIIEFIENKLWREVTKAF
jgi:CDP-6-deoxy-D-xylo-4-hexulose-3-dehydrase